ncbi:unnamed protein product [Bubo scandiacus]
MTASAGDSGPRPGHTVLVQGLPSDTTTTDLKSLFSCLGPLCHCFIITKKGTKTCHNFGYDTIFLPKYAQRSWCDTSPREAQGRPEEEAVSAG